MQAQPRFLLGWIPLATVGCGYMSLCLHVQEPADSPHPIVHTLALYAQHVTLN